jgi:hypothetical protein
MKIVIKTCFLHAVIVTFIYWRMQLADGRRCKNFGSIRFLMGFSKLLSLVSMQNYSPFILR